MASVGRPARVRPPGERELSKRASSRQVGPSSWCGAGAVGERVDVRAPREADAVDAVEQRFKLGSAPSEGTTTGTAPACPDGAQVLHPEDHLALSRVGVQGGGARAAARAPRRW